MNLKQQFDEIELKIQKRNIDVPILDEKYSPRYLQDESVKVFNSILHSSAVNPVESVAGNMYSAPINLEFDSLVERSFDPDIAGYKGAGIDTFFD